MPHMFVFKRIEYTTAVLCMMSLLEEKVGCKIAQDTPRSIIKDNYSSSNGPTMNIICKTHPITNNRYYVLSGTIQDEIISYILVTCLCSCTHDNFSSWKGLSSTDLMFQVIRT